MAERVKTGSLADQTRRALEAIIGEMDLAASNKLPREEQLAQRLGVSRTTVRQALNDLAADGVVLRRQGKGTFVNVEAMGVRAHLSPASELTRAIERCGHKADVRPLRACEAKGEQAARARCELRLSDDEPVIEVTKQFLADGRPCAICRDWLGLEVAGGDDVAAVLTELASYPGSLFCYLSERGGRRLSWERTELDVVTASEARAVVGDEAATEVGERPMLLTRSVLYDTSDAPAVLAEEYVDTSVISFDIVRRMDIAY